MACELLASRVDGRLLAAVREAGRTVELRVEPQGAAPRAERVVKARVTAIHEGLGAVFLDVGPGPQALLRTRDLLRPASGRGRGDSGSRLRVGGDVLVQIEREGLRTKGPRATTRIAIPGRRVVLVPGVARCAVSRRIEDPLERSRLLGVLDGLARPDVGWIARSAARGASTDRIVADAQRLLAVWAAALGAASTRSAPATVLAEPALLAELLRDAPPAGFDRIAVDQDADRGAALALVRQTEPEALSRVTLHAGGSLARAAGIELDVERALTPRIDLPSGGYIWIEETEALVAVDVNSGRYAGHRDGAERSIESVNHEAAREIPRQLRLRGLGGIVAVDLIDMAARSSRDEVVAAFREALRADPARTRLAGPDAVGLLTLTRETRRPGIAAQLAGACPTCLGTGRVRERF